MTKEKIEEYSKKYKQHQLKLGKGIMIFLIVVGVIIIAAGLFVSIYDFTVSKLIVGIIMIITGLLDIPLAFKFKNVTANNITKMSNEEAYKRYCKIYGIQE